MEEHGLSDKCQILLRQSHTAYLLQYVQRLVVAIDGERAVVRLVFHPVYHHPNHPYGSQYVVGMRMSYEHIVYIGQCYPDFFQLRQYTVAASCVHQQHSLRCLQDEAGVIASGNDGVSCAQHNYSIVV